MKNINKYLLIFLFLFPTSGFSQIKVPIKKKTERRVNNEIDDAIDEGLDGIFGGKKKKTSQKTVTEEPVPEESAANAEGNADVNSSEEPLGAWTKFDFVPGDVVIFEDNLDGETNGEFPSKWDLYRGNVEIAKYGEESVINFPATENGNIVPLMKKQGDYLPEKFTVEFDAYFSEFCTKYWVEFYDKVNQKQPSGRSYIVVGPQDVYVQGFGSTNVEVPNQTYPFWKHISISFNIRALKVYYGEKRASNIPNLKVDPSGLTIVSGQCHAGNQAMIKNIRIAEGAVPLYDRFKTDGKIVTNGIKFDSGKATLKPESMGVINEIAKMMQQYQDIRLSVEGHTDSDGDDAMNQQLSEQRANTVMTKLVEMGINADRLSSKGFGESTPVADNTSPEGKANNRRVEFVKM